MAEGLVASTAKGLPVDLQRISARRLVRRIEFTPLLTEGGLAVRNDGFVIYARCGEGEAADLNSRFAEDGTGIALPRSILGRARFTIAHEIAHTFFYDIRNMPPRPRVQIDDPASATELELACNQIAGLILMPEKLLQLHFPRCDFVRPQEFRDLANVAKVSAHTVVNRFKHLRKIAHPEVIVASLTQNETWVIAAISRHYSLRNLFPDAKVGAPVNTLVDDPTFALCGGGLQEVFVTYVGHGGKRVEMQFVSEPARGGRSLFLVGRPATRLI